LENLNLLWKKYNEYALKIAEALGRTNNIVGEYTEHLANRYYDGALLGISGSGADIKTSDGRLIQVKSRKVQKLSSTQLNVIRSWEFDYLLVIIFDQMGNILKALEAPREIAKEYAVKNVHQNGWVITTTKAFLNDDRMNDISVVISKLNDSDAP
jgi:hypothetical protein